MFEVKANYNISSLTAEAIELRDEEIYIVAGRISDYAGYDGYVRDHGWITEDFNTAYDMKLKLQSIGLTAKMSESVSNVNLIVD